MWTPPINESAELTQGALWDRIVFCDIRCITIRLANKQLTKYCFWRQHVSIPFFYFLNCLTISECQRYSMDQSARGLERLTKTCQRTSNLFSFISDSNLINLSSYLTKFTGEGDQSETAQPEKNPSNMSGENEFSRSLQPQKFISKKVLTLYRDYVRRRILFWIALKICTNFVYKRRYFF